MIQDINPHRFDNRFLPDASPAPDSFVFVFREEDVLLCASAGKENPPFDLPRFSAVSAQAGCQDPASYVYLFTVDDTACYYLPEGFPAQVPELFSFQSLTDVRRRYLLERHLIFITLTAGHLGKWYAESRYCGRCGHKTFHAPDERAVECPACKLRVYPKIMPAVIVAVTNGDEIVLTRYANRSFSYHALVAGFTEIGETLEETVRREVMEEVGLKVKNIRYYKSQPWAVAGDILAGYFCDVDGDPAIRVDEQELKEAVWVKREDVDGQPDDFSLTNEMMMVFREGREPE